VRISESAALELMSDMAFSVAFEIIDRTCEQLELEEIEEDEAE
jgi:hypothetical protein